MKGTWKIQRNGILRTLQGRELWYISMPREQPSIFWITVVLVLQQGVYNLPCKAVPVQKELCDNQSRCQNKTSNQYNSVNLISLVKKKKTKKIHIIMKQLICNCLSTTIWSLQRAISKLFLFPPFFWVINFALLSFATDYPTCTYQDSASMVTYTNKEAVSERLKHSPWKSSGSYMQLQMNAHINHTILISAQIPRPLKASLPF